MADEVILCPCCGSEDEHEVIGCNWYKCTTCKAQWDEDVRDDDALPWKCYHCGEVLKTYEAAHCHFGPSQYSKPFCQITPDNLREMEKELETYRGEDTKLHLEIARLHVEHRAALQREEEKGYARGLKDACQLEPLAFINDKGALEPTLQGVFDLRPGDQLVRRP